MKKIMSLMLGLSLIVGSAAISFAAPQDPAPEKGKGKGKGKGKKGGDGDKDKAHRSTSSN